MPTAETTLTRTGNSVTTSISAAWRNSVGLNPGDKVRQEWTAGGTLTLTPVKPIEDHLDDVLDFFAYVDGEASAPWSDESPASDRRLARKHYVE